MTQESGPQQRRESFLESPLPNSEDSEKTILGAILLDNSLIAQPIEELSPEDFYSPFHRRVFAAMRILFDKATTIDPITLANEMKAQGQSLESFGGVPRIADLTFGLPRFSDLDNYISIVKTKSVARQVMRVGNVIAERALDESLSTEDLLDQCENQLFAVSQQGERSGFSHIAALINESVDRAAAARDNQSVVTGLATGFVALDNLTLGLHPSELIIVAARPSMGKTAFATNIAQNICFRQQGCVAFFSLEMSEEQIADRIICSELGLNSQQYRRGDLHPDQWEEIRAFAPTLTDSLLFIDDTPSIGVSHIRARLRRLVHERRLVDLVIVDYLQLMTGRTTESREREVAQISRDLKAIAKEFNIPVMAIAQLNRNAEARASHLPSLADLRESGGIEQDADVVLFVFREDYYRQSPADYDNIGQIIIAKQRNGPTDTVRVHYSSESVTFTNLPPSQF